MAPLPRGMPGEASGDVCPMRGGTPGRPCRCCQLGEGLLVSLGPEISRWAWAAAAGGRPGMGTLQARDQAGCVLEAVGGGRSGLLSSCLVGGSK